MSDLAGLQVPLAQAFLWLLVLHALDTPNRHGLLVLLVASLVLVSLAGVLSISMAIAPWLLIWGFAALVALGLAYRAELEELPGLGGGRHPGWSRRARRPRRDPRRGPVGGFAVFMVVPVAGTNRALTFPSQLPDDTPVRSGGQLTNPSLGAGDPSSAGKSTASAPRASFGYFGFSKQLDTSLRGRPDDTLVMRVRASSPDFWRGQTFDRWNGRVWTVSRDEPRLIRGGSPIGVPRVPADGPVETSLDVDDSSRRTTWSSPARTRSSPRARRPRCTSPTAASSRTRTAPCAPGATRPRRGLHGREPAGAHDASGAPPPAHAPVPDDIASQYAVSPVTTYHVRRSPTRSPPPRPPPTTRCPPSSTGSARTPGTRSTSPGSRSAPTPSTSSSSSTARVLRTDRHRPRRHAPRFGVPARLAVGYAPGERNPFTGLYEVKASNTHTWAEVYFPGIGWQGFDPTADVPLAGTRRSTPPATARCAT